MKTDNFAQGVNYANQALSSALFKPNIIFLALTENKHILENYPSIFKEAQRLELGVILYVPHPRALLGREQQINVWLDDRGQQWNIEKDTGNIDLPILTAYKLMRNWNANIRLIAVVNQEKNERNAQKVLRDIVALARMPIMHTEVRIGELDQLLIDGPYADLNIFPTQDPIDLSQYAETIHRTHTSCLFIQDSGNENILA